MVTMNMKNNQCARYWSIIILSEFLGEQLGWLMAWGVSLHLLQYLILLKNLQAYRSVLSERFYTLIPSLLKALISSVFFSTFSAVVEIEQYV